MFSGAFFLRTSGYLVAKALFFSNVNTYGGFASVYGLGGVFYILTRSEGIIPGLENEIGVMLVLIDI